MCVFMCVCMYVLVHRLQKQFGRFIKFKNGFALPEKEAEKQFHLRKCLVSKERPYTTTE